MSQPSRSNRLGLATWGLAVTVLIAPLGTACATEHQAQTDEPTAGATTDPTPEGMSLTGYDPRPSLAPMLKRVMPAVVSIKAMGDASPHSGSASQGIPPWMRPMMPNGARRPPPRMGVGSGFVIDKSGVVVTNHHVVDGDAKLEVTLGDGRVVAAVRIGSDPLTDIALIQLTDAGDLPVVAFGSSDRLAVGDWVVAVGSPMGLEQTATTGIVSAKGRGSLNLYRASYLDFLQTDAPISPGSSGGPLFNLKGQVVGINTAVNGVGQSLGFAIPASQAERVINELREHGKVARGWVGISGSDTIPAVGKTPPPGAMVAKVHPDTPAERAGLASGDRIVKVDGKTVRDFKDFRSRIARYAPDSAVKLEVVRENKTKKLTITLGKRPTQKEIDQIARREREARRGGRGGEHGGSLYGGDKPRLGIDVRPEPGGLRINRVLADSLAARLGLKPGDLLFEVNGRETASVEDVAKGLAEKLGTVEVKVKRAGKTVVGLIQRG
ncbi:MAG: trypsin-like peptidase domain-containing protein [Nannocystaceae bacterium]